MTGRLEILIDGEWHEVPGVASVEIRMEPSPAEGPLATTGAEEAAHPRVIDQDGRPVRPAWQSPYGPAPRRH